MKTIRTYFILIFLIGTTSLFAQTEKIAFTTTDSLSFTPSINLHLKKKFQIPLSNTYFTSALFTENRWKNSYNPANTSLVKDETTGYWVNLDPSYYPISDYKSLLITGLIFGVLSK